jgi:hypothetical protein
MRRRFLPAPEAARCCAATWCGFYMARCPSRRAPGSDVCAEHRAAEAKGRKVRRVKSPAVEAQP